MARREQRPRPMKAWYNTEVDENGNLLALITVRHEDYQSYSRAVQPFATKTFRNSYIEVLRDFALSKIKVPLNPEMFFHARLTVEDPKQLELLEVEAGQTASVYIYRLAAKQE